MKCKLCPKCGQSLSLDQFHKNKRQADGFQSSCKICHGEANKRSAKKNPDTAKRAALKYCFGMTLEKFAELEAKQNGLCAICFKPETRTHKGKTWRLSVDHCHKTGKVRGLLCAACNLMIGKARDEIAILESAISYLSTNSGGGTCI